MNIGESFYCSRCMKKMEEEDICPFCGYDPDTLAGKAELEEGILLQDGRYQLGTVYDADDFCITYAAWDHMFQKPVFIKEYFPGTFAKRVASETTAVSVDTDNKTRYAEGLLQFIKSAKKADACQRREGMVKKASWFEANNTAYIVTDIISGGNNSQAWNRNLLKCN